MTGNHAKRNVIQHRQLNLCNTMKQSPALPGAPEQSSSTSVAQLNIRLLRIFLNMTYIADATKRSQISWVSSLKH
jgi:hypothetical protein